MSDDKESDGTMEDDSEVENGEVSDNVSICVCVCVFMHVWCE